MLCSNEEKSWKTGSKAGHPDAMGFINSEWTRMDGLQQLVLSGRPLSISHSLSRVVAYRPTWIFPGGFYQIHQSCIDDG
jgi:hypothetical protein